MSPALVESDVEEAALGWFQDLGYAVRFGPEIAPGEVAAERDDLTSAVLPVRLRDAIARLNPGLPQSAVDDAVRKLLVPPSASLVANNRAFHSFLVSGVPVEYRRPDGTIAGVQAKVIDFEHTEENNFLVVNQFAVINGPINRRPDIVVFVNGLPLAVIELKNAADENATTWTAFKQLQTYKQQIPALFVYNEALIISDGLKARIGSLTADQERFAPWRTIRGDDLAPAVMPELEGKRPA
jgi:type I restriction enzyme R subunit